MGYLITQILFCLLLAAAIGLVVGWLIRRFICQKQAQSLEASWSARHTRVENERDELAARVAALEARAKTAASTTSVASKTAGKGEYAIEEIEGIGKGFGSKLRAIDIKTTEDLLERCRTDEGLTSVASQTGLEPILLRKCTSMADFMRLGGVRSQNSELLEAAGVSSVQDLATRGPGGLTANMGRVNERLHLTRVGPTGETVTQWVQQAKTLGPRIEWDTGTEPTPRVETDTLRRASMAPGAEKPLLFSGPRGTPDDLKQISGVGPKLERTLHELGVYHFHQIAQFTSNNVAWVDDYLNFKGRIQREGWVEQAVELAAGRPTEFSRRYLSNKER